MYVGLEKWRDEQWAMMANYKDAKEKELEQLHSSVKSKQAHLQYLKQIHGAQQNEVLNVTNFEETADEDIARADTKSSSEDTNSSSDEDDADADYYITGAESESMIEPEVEPEPEPERMEEPELEASQEVKVGSQLQPETKPKPESEREKGILK